MSTIRVTGGSSFIGSHCLLQLLAAGHEVRTTVRSLQRESHVRAMLKEGGADPGDRLSFFVADLENDEGWSAADAGCDFVLHVASPFPPTIPRHEDELIVPASKLTDQYFNPLADNAAGTGAIALLLGVEDGTAESPAETTRADANGRLKLDDDKPFRSTSEMLAAPTERYSNIAIGKFPDVSEAAVQMML